MIATTEEKIAIQRLRVKASNKDRRNKISGNSFKDLLAVLVKAPILTRIIPVIQGGLYCFFKSSVLNADDHTLTGVERYIFVLPTQH